MTKTNTKQAKANIRNYIMNNFHADSYSPKYDNASTFEEIATAIKTEFENEMSHRLKHYNKQNVFFEWCQGLPSIISTDYYYNRSAVEDLGDILEQSKYERNRFSERQAEEKLTYLIYRELYEC